jgi:predicted nucleic acid-binding protein
MILIDTDHFSILTNARDARHLLLLARLEACGELLSIPVVSIEEQLRGWLAQVRRQSDVQRQIFPYDRLIRLLEALSQ